MKSNNLSFERARGLVKGCLYAAVAFCVIALFLNADKPDLAVYASYAAVLLLVLGLFFVAVCLKCPYCGKRIIVKCLTTKNCTHCGRDLTTGIKAKGKGKRR